MDKIILFFISGFAPTAEEARQAHELGTNRFRNASQVFEGDSVEKCDAVAGNVPKIYRDRFPFVGIEPNQARSVVAKPAEAAPVPAPEPETQPNPDAQALKAQRDAEDEAAANATAKQLKEALANLGIPAPKAMTKKADLLALFLARP